MIYTRHSIATCVGVSARCAETKIDFDGSPGQVDLGTSIRVSKYRVRLVLLGQCLCQVYSV